MTTPEKIFGAFLILFAGGAVGYWMPTPSVDVTVSWATAKDEYNPSYSLQGGKEIAFIFIGASSCGAARGDSITSIVRTAKKAARNHADSMGVSYSTLGVSKDWSAQKGAEYLKNFGKFDEISSGRSWLNIGILRYIYNEVSGTPGIPQIILVRRTVSGVEAPTYSIDDDKILIRKVGINEIKQWSNLGYPMPQVEI